MIQRRFTYQYTCKLCGRGFFLTKRRGGRQVYCPACARDITRAKGNARQEKYRARIKAQHIIARTKKSIGQRLYEINEERKQKAKREVPRASRSGKGASKAQRPTPPRPAPRKPMTIPVSSPKRHQTKKGSKKNG